jgi:hypothetical protein
VKIESIEKIIARNRKYLLSFFKKQAYDTTEARNSEANSVVSIPMTEWNAKYGVNASGNAARKYNLNLFSVKILTE